MQHVYETQRLYLRVLNEWDVDTVLSYFVQNEEFLAPWEAQRPEYFFTSAYQSMQLRGEMLQMKEGRMLRLWMFAKEDSDRIIGSLCYSSIVYGCFLSCFLGYRLSAENANRGYMSEAVARGNEVMFSEYGLHRIEANIMPRNAASLRVVQKLGFAEEGLAKRYLKINGIWEDHVHMVLLNDNV